MEDKLRPMTDNDLVKGWGARVAKPLLRAGLDTYTKVYFSTDKALLTIPGFGVKALAIVRARPNGEFDD